MVTVIDKQGIATLVHDMLKADTSILYGADKLVQDITTSAVDFIKSKVDNSKPYKLFLVCDDKQTIEVLPQTAKHRYIVSYRIEGISVDPEIARTRIDDIDTRIDTLINNQMFSGLMFTHYYNDTNSRIVDAEYDNSGLVTEIRGDRVIAECSGAIALIAIKYN